MSGAALRLDGVACLRGGRMLFRGVDLSLEPGGGALLTGPNGVGKSSLLRICAGLLPAFVGRVERRGGVALCDERLALDSNLALRQSLAFWAGLDGATSAQLDAAIDAMALGPLSSVPVRMLSTGQRKRAMLARLIASDTAIWLLDEPGNGLDTASLDLLGHAVTRHLAAGGIIVAASHQPLPLAAPVTIALDEYRADDPVEPA